LEEIVTTSETDYTAEIAEHRWLSKKTFEIKLSRPEAFNFISGQRITLKHQNLERDYSLASAPEDSHLALCIRHVEGGQLSQILGDNSIGTRLAFYGPHGYFTFKPSPRPAVLVATGTGIAPFRSMVRSGVTDIMLLHGVTHPDELYYADNLQAAVMHYIPCISEPNQLSENYYSGRVTDYLQMHLNPGVYDFYLCGRNEMIRDATLLIDERFPGSFIYTEQFF
jgi:benzoate/toluate 1,2-dioxygenase reductase component